MDFYRLLKYRTKRAFNFAIKPMAAADTLDHIKDFINIVIMEHMHVQKPGCLTDFLYYYAIILHLEAVEDK